VYVFLQSRHIFPEGVVVAVATVGFQLFCFWVFFKEAYNCGLAESEECTLGTTGLLVTHNGTTTLDADSSVTSVGIGMGITIVIAFLLPDFLKGLIFLRRQYYLIGLVHIAVSLSAIVTAGIYTASTSVSDVSILTNVVVLLFITDFDEKMFEIHTAARKFLRDQGYKDV